MAEKKIYRKRGRGLLCVVLMAAAALLCLLMLYGKRQKEAFDFFYDDEFGDIVKYSLQVPADTPEEELLSLMEQTESLYLFGGIKSLEDLKYFPNLKILSLQLSNQNQYPPYQSNSPERLSLDDVSGIRYATELEELIVFDQNLGDLSFLENLNKLEKLDLNHCTFINPAALGGCTSLTVLKLWRNSLVQLDFLEHLVNLKELDILENVTVFTGYEGLGNLTRMEKLYLHNTGINQIEFVRNMPDLKDIHITAGKIRDISHLSGHEKLESIVLVDNEINDISTLKDLKSLRHLTIEGGYVSDISPLVQMKELQSLSIDNNRVMDISPLKDLPKIKFLSMGSNPVEDISVLSQIGNLTILVMDRYVIERIQDIRPLVQIPNMSLHSVDEEMDFKIACSLDESMIENEEMELWCEENLNMLRYYKLDDVSYGDIDGDGIEDAAIVLSYGTEERTQSDSGTYPWKQKVLVLKRDSSGALHQIEELEVGKRKGIEGYGEDYAYTNTLLRNGCLLIQETCGNTRPDKWQTDTKYYGFENGKIRQFQSNQYKYGRESYVTDPNTTDRVIMTNVKEGNREEFLLAYDENDPLSKCWRKIPVARNGPPDVVFSGRDGTNVLVSPDGFSWNYMANRERNREQDTSFQWKPSAKSPKEPVHPLFPPGAANRPRESLSLPKAEAEPADSVEFYLNCDVRPNRLTVYEWLLEEKSKDGVGYDIQPWPDSEVSPDLSDGMPVTVSLKPGRLYEIVMVWDGENLEKNGFSGESQYLLETRN